MIASKTLRYFSLRKIRYPIRKTAAKSVYTSLPKPKDVDERARKEVNELKFSDVILAVAVAEVITVLIDVVLFMVLIKPLGSMLALNSASIISILIASLLVGYFFALRIKEESRIMSIGKIAILAAFVQSFAVMISFPSNPYYAAWTKDTLQTTFQTGSWTTTDWFGYQNLMLIIFVALNVALVLVLGFIGLYAGSMLRKPGKT